MNRNGIFLAGFILGGLIGAAIAFVFSPSMGGERRKSVVTDGVHHQSVNTQYEAPRIILDEGMNASVSTGSDDV